MQTSHGVIAVLLIGILSQSAAQAATQTIMLTGFWSPTNDMLREFSKNASQNSGGWQGQNWEGLGYDVEAFFPEYQNASDGVGEGDFRVDFAATYDDFMKYTEALHPVAIVAFGLDATISGWRVETDFPNSFFTAGQTTVPSTISVLTEGAIPDTLISASDFSSSLPTEALVNAIQQEIQSIPSASGLDVSVGTPGSAGNYLCGFMGYLASWYHAQHADPSDPAQNRAAGFVHVGPTTAVQSIAVDTDAVHAILRALIAGMPSQ